ncbi:MAG TPA: phospho-sugar mutase [Actinomycetaceae bacterium]|nr:phospho-sugar mutase [Actinomycetaceae bacterium]
MMTLDQITAWIDADPDEWTRAELRDLLGRSATDEAAAAELSDRFDGTLEFGTAGLRGALGGGPNRMNRAVVIRAAAGLAAWLKETVGPDFSVVIGCDARYGSEQFARDTAAVVTAAGGRALLLPPRQPTPVLAFAVLHLDTDAGVMVTASHNPRNDNGYKVYLGGAATDDAGRGVQLISPADVEIAAAIDSQPLPDRIPRTEDGWDRLGDEVRQAYLERAVSIVPHGRAGHLRIVHTAMHGVGGATALEAFERAGYNDVRSVTEQALPNPDFPTVDFPNPEEPGALDLALELAERVNADVIIANDPDADRCSVAVPVPDGWRQLSGDEVGWLLGTQAAAFAVAAGGSGTLACSIVSSRMLERIAAAHGLEHAYTPTGFKWISRAPGLVYGYEEALGYCVDPQAVRDKDGISAGIRIALLASQLGNQSETLLDQLDRLERSHGVHATRPLTIRVEDLDVIAAAMRKLREAPPAELAGSRVVEAVDLAVGGWRGLPATDALYYLTEANDRVVVRPSGTEPKLKCYLESIVEIDENASDDDLAAARARARERVNAVNDHLAELIGS